MTDREFELLRQLIQSSSGIQLHDSKRSMLENRLRRLVRDRDMTAYLEYYDYVREAGPAGLSELHDAITTRTTEFFRFGSQQRFFETGILPELVGRLRREPGLATLWSAGCSSGEEAVSVVISLRELVPASLQERFAILGTDLSPTAIEEARRGRYSARRVATLPPQVAARYFTPCPEGGLGLRPEVRARIRYDQANLQDPPPLPEASADVVFCRNVLIYFSESARSRIVETFMRTLRPGGHLLLGPSESLLGKGLALDPVAPSVYRKS